MKGEIAHARIRKRSQVPEMLAIGVGSSADKAACEAVLVYASRPLTTCRPTGNFKATSKSPRENRSNPGGPSAAVPTKQIRHL
jgi:hypothetical protein